LLFAVNFFVQCTKNGGSSEKASVGVVGQGGSMARFTIVGNYLYTVDHQKLTVYDISAGNNPVLKKSQSVGFEIETIYPFADKLFIGSTTVVHIFSIADPVNPVRLSTAISPDVIRRCDPVVAKDTVAFATLRTNGACGGQQSILAIFDIKDITNPIQKGSFPLMEPYGLGYSNDVLYVCDISGLKIFDISKPFQPRLYKTITGTKFTDVIAYQNTLICWVQDGVMVYDISNRQDPVFLAKII
jgi:hypothetical protein